MKCFEVSEISGLIKKEFDSCDLLKNICIHGEISNFKLHSSGHLYFSLKDNDSSIKCVMFRNNAAKLKFTPENGMKVFAGGYISVYIRDGYYQLIASDIVPEGLGELQLRLEQLKQKLQEKGYFSLERKKRIPSFPHRICIITSPTGAAIHDMIRILGHRWPLAEVYIIPVSVQGITAALEISQAINHANQFKVADLLIIGRGGGSIEDLWVFNDELIADAVFQSSIPVISGVGHEPDVVLSDLVADCRAATPSNAAELSVPDQKDMYLELNSLQIRLCNAITNTISICRKRINTLRERSELRNPEKYYDIKRFELSVLEDKLSDRVCRILNRKHSELDNAISKLDAMSPLKVLMRGYSVVTTNDGRIISDITDINISDSVNISFHNGIAKCKVTEIEENHGK